MVTRIDLPAALEALGVQWTLLADSLATLTDPDRAGPSVLPGWTVGDLGAHLVRSAGAMTGLPAAPAGTPPMTLSSYVQRYAAAAQEIAQDARDRAATFDGDQVVAAVRSASAAQVAGFGAEAAGPGVDRRVVSAPRGPLRFVDVVLTRLVEAVTHADDLARSLAGAPGGLVDRAALRIVCRALADALADRSPGHTVELRVPPYAAVQCVPGPRHTRGTPPNVVETDPLTWLRVATGRTSWAEVVGTPALSASGERADLSGLLPLL